MIDARLDLRLVLPAALEQEHRRALEQWQAEDGTSRLFRRDASLWTGGSEGRWLGWLDIVAREQERLGELQELRARIAARSLERALLLGMGGSSLGPEVLARTLGRRSGHPELVVLDSTDPGALHAGLAGIDWRRTVVLAASKSGTTLETSLLLDYCLEQLSLAGLSPHSHLIALTDPGSALEARARQLGCLEIFSGDPEIGGRFSVLSRFGLVPAAVLGLDLERLLEAAARAVSSAARQAAASNPGIALGLLLGVAARAGRDKVTLLASPRLESLGAWLEQLLAESSGKNGQGVLPVDLEPPAEPARYGPDRLFLVLELAGDSPDPLAEHARHLAGAGHPVVWLRLGDAYELAGAFFTLEVTVAVLCSWLGVEPFEQPDVEASKVKTAELTAQIEQQGGLPEEPEAARAGPLRFYTLDGSHGPGDAQSLLRSLLAGLGPPGYLALLGFLRPEPERAAALRAIRALVRDRTGAATLLGYGPRYLHSTGQAFKGGPPGGVFLVLTDEPGRDVPVPGRRLSFRQVRDAQALGDAQVLAQRGRRVLRVHLGGETVAGLQRLRQLIAESLAG